MAQDPIVHVDDSIPGISRRALKSGWGYHLPDGTRIVDGQGACHNGRAISRAKNVA